MSRQKLDRHRARQWSRLQPAIARTPALAQYHGKPLTELPVIDPAEMRADYGAWNSCGKRDEEFRQLAGDAEAGKRAAGDLSAGWSTGSGKGARGLFVSNEAERADYIGQSLARLLPGRALLKKQRLALHLRASNSLYSDVKTRRFAFTHIPLECSQAESLERLKAFAPTILIAPPHRLLSLANARLDLPSLNHLFCGSEPISKAERMVIEDSFGLRPRSIYQATEGFLGAECHEGRLHLNEHALDIELEPVEGTRGFRPIISDLRRTSQPIIRLRGDDFLELAADQAPCPCGFQGRVIAPPQGRVSDLWPLGSRVITPSQVVAAVEAEHEYSGEWQAIGCPTHITFRTAPSFHTAQVHDAVMRLQDLSGLRVKVERDLPGWSGPKRHKVVWADG